MIRNILQGIGAALLAAFAVVLFTVAFIVNAVRQIIGK